MSIVKRGNEIDVIDVKIGRRDVVFVRTERCTDEDADTGIKRRGMCCCWKEKEKGEEWN